MSTNVYKYEILKNIHEQIFTLQILNHQLNIFNSRILTLGIIVNKYENKFTSHTWRMATDASSQTKKLDERKTTLRQLYCWKTSTKNVPILLKGPSVRPSVV